ncbi:MAG TPA: RNA polymerase sigma-70 factor [Sunxiuqinia sp.]|nr:RNA polymerase sigma-70 factor [Sunxiuqinia sp.]
MIESRMLKNENRLVKQLKASDVAAFDQLFEGYSSRLFGFAINYLKTESEAEELVQEVFVRVWENRQSLKPDQSFKAYLYTIALNQIRKHFRKRAVALNYLSQLDSSDFEMDSKTEDSLDYQSVLERIDAIVDQLPERKKQIFLKSRKEGKSSKDIAEELAISVGTVDNQISSALKIIREILTRENLAVLLFFALFLN